MTLALRIHYEGAVYHKKMGIKTLIIDQLQCFWSYRRSYGSFCFNRVEGFKCTILSSGSSVLLTSLRDRPKRLFDVPIRFLTPRALPLLLKTILIFGIQLESFLFASVIMCSFVRLYYIVSVYSDISRLQDHSSISCVEISCWVGLVWLVSSR